MTLVNGQTHNTVSLDCDSLAMNRAHGGPVGGSAGGGGGGEEREHKKM